MNACEIEDKWRDGELERSDVFDYLNVNREMGEWEISDEELEHVSNCLYSLYQLKTNERVRIGGFMKAVLQNDLYSAAGKADSTNQQYLWIHTLFIHNCIPQGDLEVLRTKVD